MFGVCILAALRGRKEERWLCAAVVVNWIASVSLYRRSEDAQFGILAADLVMFGVFIWFTLRSRRHWPLFGAGFCLLMLITHVGKVVDPSIRGWAYITAELIWSYMILVSIGYGAWTAPRRYAEIEADEAAEAPGATFR